MGVVDSILRYNDSSYKNKCISPILVSNMEWGKQYFITATINKWQNLLDLDNVKQILVDVWEWMSTRGHIEVHGFVIMPNHYHAIISFKSPKESWETQRDIHKWVSKSIIAIIQTKNPDALQSFISTQGDRKYHIWQRNSLPILLYNDSIVEQKLDYIHANPLQEKWKLCTLPEEYYFSSASFYLLNKSPFSFLKHYKN